MRDAQDADARATLNSPFEAAARTEPMLRRLPSTSFGAELWLVELAGWRGGEALADLSADERVRAERFVFAADRERYAVAHRALRTLLAARLSLTPDEIEFEIGEHGKPALPPHIGSAFNMSHSGDIALVCLGRGFPFDVELGVDIEVVHPVSAAGALAAAYFTAREQVELAASTPAERDRLFLHGWTRKEACLKAVGSGLSIAPATFECGLAPHRAVTRITTPRGPVTVGVESIQIDRDHVAAVAVTAPESPR